MLLEKLGIKNLNEIDFKNVYELYRYIDINEYIENGMNYNEVLIKLPELLKTEKAIFNLKLTYTPTKWINKTEVLVKVILKQNLLFPDIFDSHKKLLDLDKDRPYFDGIIRERISVNIYTKNIEKIQVMDFSKYNIKHTDSIFNMYNLDLLSYKTRNFINEYIDGEYMSGRYSDQLQDILSDENVIRELSHFKPVKPILLYRGFSINSEKHTRIGNTINNMKFGEHKLIKRTITDIEFINPTSWTKNIQVAQHFAKEHGDYQNGLFVIVSNIFYPKDILFDASLVKDMSGTTQCEIVIKPGHYNCSIRDVGFRKSNTYYKTNTINIFEILANDSIPVPDKNDNFNIISINPYSKEIDLSNKNIKILPDLSEFKCTSLNLEGNENIIINRYHLPHNLEILNLNKTKISFVSLVEIINICDKLTKLYIKGNNITKEQIIELKQDRKELNII